MLNRRTLLQSIPVLGVSGAVFTPFSNFISGSVATNKIKLCLNAYSFNKPLRAGEMSIDELLEFAAATGFHGVDLTAYYIPDYPEIPSDEVLFGIKQKAFRLGVAITGTGVRNDFTLAPSDERQKSIQLVKDWVVAAAKMGAPHVRVFDGRAAKDEPDRKTVKKRIIEGFQECADFAANHGVMISFQNHDEYIITASEVIEIVEAVDSKWFGLMLDIGSLPAKDPYVEIEQLIPYAISWQVKENVKTASGSEPTDFARLLGIVHSSGYQGYFPLETLGEGDPYEKVKKLYQKVKPLLIKK